MKSLGRYEILAEIGRGATGIVYRGRDTKIDRQVALKCLQEGIFVASEETRKCFQREILALGRLVHPNIVTIFDAGEDNGIPYIVMEYISGISLGQRLTEETPLTLDEIVQIGIAICRALDYAHSKGVIHRDIKPGNILLTSEQRTVKVTDFGIARLDKGGYTQLHQILGTPQYMSPEQCEEEPIDGRSDLFSVGTLLYELLTRRKPFAGGNFAVVMHQVVTKNPVPPITLSPNIPKSLNDIIVKAMEKEPNLRFSTGAEMAEALASFTLDQTQSVEGPSTLILHERQEVCPPAPAGRRKYGMGAIIAAMGISVLAGGLIFRSLQKPSAPTSGGAVSTLQNGTVDLTSLPMAAEVFINGESKGITPLVLDLPAGPYELALNKEGYHPLEATITVASGEKVPIALTLTKEEEMP